MAKCNDQVYVRIGKELNANPKTVYLAATRYVKKRKTLLTSKEHDSNERSNKSLDETLSDTNNQSNNTDEENEKDYENEYTLFDSEFKVSKDDKCYEIDITNIGLFSYSDQEMKQQIEWSDTLNAIIWEYSRLPCCWCFNKNRNVANEKIVFANCRAVQCSAKLFAYTENKQSKLKITIKGFNKKAVHNKKRSVKGVNKKKVVDLLKLNNPSVAHAELANDALEFDDYCPAHLPKPATMRKIKQREKEKNFRDADPIRSICLMKKESLYHNCIHDIGIDPFYCIFVIPEQREWLRLATRFKRCVISIDSTGAPVKAPAFSSISSKTGNLKPIFLYVISLQFQGAGHPIFQILSQRHTSDFISYFLKYWRHNFNSMKNPNEIIMDNSSALILASVQSFTSFQTVSKYLDYCYETIFETKTDSSDVVFIRLDRSHIVKEILRLQAIQQQDSRLKIMLQRVLGFLVTAEDIETVKKIIINVFIVIFNRFEHITEVTEAKWELKTIVDQRRELVDEHNIEENIVATQTIFTEHSKFKNWVKTLVKHVQDNLVDTNLNDSNIDSEKQREMSLVENIYYTKDEKKNLENCLVNFLSTIPLWSNVMIKHFGSINKTATSSTTEAEFRNLKQIIFKNENGIRVDIFVDKYLQYLIGRFKHSLAENKNQHGKLFGEDQDVDNSQGTIYEVSQEIWRDKNVDVIESKKPVKPNRSRHSILEAAKPFSAHIPILPNGNTTVGNKKKPTVICRNTCTFDALYQTYAAFYKDIPKFANIIENSELEFDVLVKSSFNVEKEEEIIELRNDLICSTFPEKIVFGPENTRTIDAYMCMNEMFHTLQSKSTILYSMKIICEDCSSEIDVRRYIPTRFRGNWQYTIKNLDRYLDHEVYAYNNVCENCSSSRSKIEFNEVVVIEIENAYPDESIHPIEKDEISKVIILDRIKYGFRAAIQFTNKHFIAHILRGNNKWETYDGLNNAKVQRTPKSFHSILYFYGNFPNSINFYYMPGSCTVYSYFT